MKTQILFVTKFGYIILWRIPNLCDYIQKLKLLGARIRWALYTYKFQCIEVVSKREEKEKNLGFHILVSEISQMLGLCMPWNHMDYSILLEAKKAYHQVVQLYEGYVMEYHSKEDSMGRGQMGWGHFHANNSFLSCSRSSILREHFGGQIIPSCSRCIFYTLF